MSPMSDPIQVLSATPAIFSDDFSTETFSNWTPSPDSRSISGDRQPRRRPSARAQVTAQSAFATKDARRDLQPGRA